MRTIEVEYDLSTIFRDYVFVDRKQNQKECGCDPLQMSPAMPVNAKSYKDAHICITCGNQVRDIMVDWYNQYYGYSGYDENE